MKKNQDTRTIGTLPSPKGHFLLGHLPRFKAGPKHLVLEKWVKECGNLFRIHFAGTPFIVSADSDFNEQVLRQRPETFRRHPKISEILEEMSILGVFNAEGDAWRRYRQPTAEALNLKKVQGFYPILAHKGQQLLEMLDLQSKAKNEIEITSLIKRFTTDVTAEVAFGYRLNSLGEPNSTFQEDLTLVFPMVNERMSTVVPLWRWWKRPRDRAFEKALKRINATVLTFIESAKKRLAANPELRDHPNNFLEALLVEQESKHFTDAEVFSAVFTLLLAGEDTTSNSISWALFFLAQHSEVVEEVRREATLKYPGGHMPDTADRHTNLVYAQAVAMETIRLKPTSPQLILQAQEDTVVEGLVIPKKTNLILQNRIGQLSETHFSKPDAFLPQRWLKNRCPAHFQHQPVMIKAFGGGPRYCPGKHLALHEIVMVISSVCKHFNLGLVESPDNIQEQFSFTMHPSPFHLQLRKITP